MSIQEVSSQSVLSTELFIHVHAEANNSCNLVVFIGSNLRHSCSDIWIYDVSRNKNVCNRFRGLTAFAVVLHGVGLPEGLHYGLRSRPASIHVTVNLSTGLPHSRASLKHTVRPPA